MQVGFIGLGTMGRPMAINVVKAGLDLVVYDVREEPLRELARLGAKIAHSPCEIAERAEIIEIAVVDDAQVEAVVAGEAGILKGARAGSIIAIHSTISHKTAKTMADLGRPHGVQVLDAPVSGGQRGAEERELCYMVGGSQEAFERCRSVFAASAAHIFHMGEIGTGAAAKMILQAVVCVNMLAAHEAELICEKIGLDFKSLQKAFHVSSAQSFVVDHWIDRFKRPHDPMSIRQQRTEVFHKSLSPVLERAHELELRLPGAALAQQLLSRIMGIEER